MVWRFPFIWLETTGLILPITNVYGPEPGLTYLNTWALSEDSQLTRRMNDFKCLQNVFFLLQSSVGISNRENKISV